jgi:hypothetical protein
VIQLRGLIASVKHKKVIVQVPVDRVINSMGLAVKSSKYPKTNNLSNGINPSTKTIRFAKFIFIMN